jgi:hypothetical protein
LFALIAARGKNEDPGGLGGDVDGDVSGDEAMWRDLIARYEMPVAGDAAAMPWPERENLQNSAREPSRHVADAPPAVELGPGTGEEQPETPAGTAAGGTGEAGTAEAGMAEADSTGGETTGAGTAQATAPANGDRRVPGAGADRTRVVRHAHPVPRPAAADADAAEDEDEDGHYVPPPPPPLPTLDSVGKGAWAALFGGPCYLVVATILGWSVSSWAALAAVAAFVSGFAVVILRMGDGPSRGDGPDNGAVV